MLSRVGSPMLTSSRSSARRAKKLALPIFGISIAEKWSLKLSSSSTKKATFWLGLIFALLGAVLEKTGVIHIPVGFSIPLGSTSVESFPVPSNSDAGQPIQLGNIPE